MMKRLDDESQISDLSSPNHLITKLSNQKNHFNMEKKEIAKFVVQTLLAILSAIATALGVTSCMAML